jgi:hypothetical protein
MAASLGVLAFGALAATPAMAFDNIEWNWKKDVREKVDIYVDIKVDVRPTGLVEVEKLQIFLGDVHATNYVAHIYNEPFYPGAGYHDAYYVPDKERDYSMSFCFVGCGGGYKDGWDKVPVKPLDARYEMPIILASAVAVGNNQSITSDVPVFLHDGQFVAGVRDGEADCNRWCDLMAALPSDTSTASFSGTGWNQPQGNLHHEVALLFGILGAVGLLKPAEITAQSTVYDVKNVSVDNSSTAVANNISVNLLSDTPSNHVLIADITQFALANVTATTRTTNVTATGYDHMRQLTTDTLSPTDSDPTRIVKVPTPWVSSTATAVGNNVSINVGPVLAE